MAEISERMEQHHKRCDDKFVAAEAAVHDGDWAAAGRLFVALCADLEAHFAAEEGLLFPAFERRTGVVGGPTAVMRMEHVQMRSLMQQMRGCLEAHDASGFGGAAETLLILMQQHNLKEENILYPMCDQALNGDAGLLAELERALHAE